MMIRNKTANLPTEGLKVEVLTAEDTARRVIVIHIPRHSFRQPVYAHHRAWMRVESSLEPISESRLMTILSEQRSNEDWSGEVVEQASLEDLDPEAIKKAREGYLKSRGGIAPEGYDSWDDLTFLNKTLLTRRGQITRTTLLLLGSAESVSLLTGCDPKIHWTLRTAGNERRDDELFEIPFILVPDRLYSKIRNAKYSVLRPGTLFPDDMVRYAAFSIREALNNCIAHQDYQARRRINVVEIEDESITFSNAGTFLPGTVESVLTNNAPPDYYRNKALVDAMRNVNMIDTEGGGILKMFQRQRERVFPMPEYDLSEGRVEVTLIGRVLDETFASLLLNNADMSLSEVWLLDKVQKRKTLSDEEVKYLKRRGWIEGRKPHFYLSSQLSRQTNDTGLQVEYSKRRGLGGDLYTEWIMKHLDTFGSVEKTALLALVTPHLPQTMTDIQKATKLDNLLRKLRLKGFIRYDADSRRWERV